MLVASCHRDSNQQHLHWKAHQIIKGFYIKEEDQGEVITRSPQKGEVTRSPQKGEVCVTTRGEEQNSRVPSKGKKEVRRVMDRIGTKKKKSTQGGTTYTYLDDDKFEDPTQIVEESGSKVPRRWEAYPKRLNAFAEIGKWKDEQEVR